MTQPNDLINFSMDSSRANGLTKREYFAAMAMQGMISAGYSTPYYVSETACNYADLLIEALNLKIEVKHEP
jgi:hypothetical protein